MPFTKYDLQWPDGTNPLDIEFYLIRNGGGKLGLFHHMREAMKLLWPKDDCHRWSDEILRLYCENEIGVVIGCSDSGKSWSFSKIVLTDYWAAADETLWLVSTTEGRGAELRIWGAIKDLFNLARENHDWLPGKPLDYLKTITSAEVDEEGFEARSLRRGIIVIPCKTGGIMSGLAPYIGIKAPRLRHCGDEVQAMNEAFLNAYSNWYGKADFRGIMAGNFMDVEDPLGLASEPTEGWDAWQDSGKTQKWKSKFYNAGVLALDGRDSPNFDQMGSKPRYPYLIGHKKLNAVRNTYGEDSWQWWSQCVGKPAKGMDIWKVFTRDFCEKHKAFQDVIWKDASTNVHLYPLDPAYGGGDRCVGRHMEFGEDVSGNQILVAHAPEVIPVKPNQVLEPEEQIALFVQNRLKELKIPAKNCFYDSFGRGTLGFAFAKIMGADCPIPVDSGMKPTTRPVRFDLFVEEKDGTKRLKRCDEHYTKFVTEMWFSVREAVESEQMRGVDKETVREGCSRKFTRNKDNRLEIEPKEDYKERCQGKSPDLMDNLAIGVEGARQRGFRIDRAGLEVIKKQGPDWLEKQTDEWRHFNEQRQLQRA